MSCQAIMGFSRTSFYYKLCLFITCFHFSYTLISFLVRCIFVIHALFDAKKIKIKIKKTIKKIQKLKKKKKILKKFLTRGIGIFSDISNSLQCSIENGFLEAYNFCQNGLVHDNPSKITKMLFFRKKKEKKIKEILKKKKKKKSSN